MKLKPWKHGNRWMTARQKRSHNKQEKEAYERAMAALKDLEKRWPASVVKEINT